MKVCLVIPLPPPYGGITNWSVMLSNYLDERCSQKIQYKIIPQSICSRSDAEGRTLFERIYFSGLGTIKTAFHLRSYIRKERPDVVHITSTGALGLIRDSILVRVARKYDVPSVWHIHMGRVPMLAKANSLEWRVLRKTALKFSNVWVLDRRTQQTFQTFLPKEVVHCVPNPIRFDVFEKERQTRKEKQVVFVGWVVKEKGVEELLSAWRTVVEKFPEYSLKLIGPCTEEYKKYLQQSFSMRKVALLGKLEHSDALKEIAKSSLLVLPSYSEGFPNVILEAMALKTPVLATDVGAVSDVLSRECGVIVAPKNVEELSVKTTMLLSDYDLRRQISENAFNKGRNEYDIKAVVQRYLELWQGVVEQSKIKSRSS